MHGAPVYRELRRRPCVPVVRSTVTDFSLDYGLNPEHVRQDRYVRPSGLPPLVRIVHIPTGIEITRERPHTASVHEFNRQLHADLAALVASSTQ